MQEELKPCPFHSHGCEIAIKKIEHRLRPRWMKDEWYQVVADCGAAGPERINRAMAINAWNTRTTEQEKEGE